MHKPTPHCDSFPSSSDPMLGRLALTRAALPQGDQLDPRREPERHWEVGTAVSNPGFKRCNIANSGSEAARRNNYVSERRLSAMTKFFLIASACFSRLSLPPPPSAPLAKSARSLLPAPSLLDQALSSMYIFWRDSRTWSISR
jgi:hypothetical protein